MDKNKTKQEIQKLAMKKRAELRGAINAVAKTPEGKKVLRWIKNYSCYGKSSMIIDPSTGEINTVGVVYNEARKDIYYGLRSFLDPKNLKEIELEEDNDNA